MKKIMFLLLSGMASIAFATQAPTNASYMSHNPVISVSPADTLGTAALTLQKNDIDEALVINGVQLQSLSAADVATYAATHPNWQATSVHDSHLLRAAQTARPGDKVANLARTTFIINPDGQMAGTVTSYDVLKRGLGS